MDSRMPLHPHTSFPGLEQPPAAVEASTVNRESRAAECSVSRSDGRRESEASEASETSKTSLGPTSQTGCTTAPTGGPSLASFTVPNSRVELQVHWSDRATTSPVKAHLIASQSGESDSAKRASSFSS